jgi:hypothetical protein
MDSQPNIEAAKWDSTKAAEKAKGCPTDWHVVQSSRDGSYYCAPLHPDAATGEALGHWLAIPIAVVLIALWRWSGRRNRAHTAAGAYAFGATLGKRLKGLFGK